jgi:23S rRNA (cytidine1920-2'-O)/16S rRNA (cytidine1409-2'-O)-methyltransferase
MISRMRIDRLLVERGLFESRAKAQAAIEAGLVVADDVPVGKASETIAANAVLRAEPAHPFVSRGGVKLAAALDHFGFDPVGCVCLDVGASTGGFTDALITRGAARVYAVDTGHGQLHPRLKGRPEIASIEGTDIRVLAPGALLPPPKLIVIDVSFISLRLVIPAALALAQPPARMIALVKPQFEAGRAHIRKGIVRDAKIHAQVCDAAVHAVGALGWTVVGLIPSPILGGDGNREFLIGASRD